MVFVGLRASPSVKDGVAACEQSEAFRMPQEAVQALWNAEALDDLAAGDVQDIDGKKSVALSEKVLRRVSKLELAVACAGFGKITDFVPQVCCPKDDSSSDVRRGEDRSAGGRSRSESDREDAVLVFGEGSFELEVDAVKAEDVDASAACADSDGFVVVLEAKVKGEIAVGEGERRDVFVFADIPSDHTAIFAA